CLFRKVYIVKFRQLFLAKKDRFVTFFSVLLNKEGIKSSVLFFSGKGNQNMAGSRVALVADDPELASSVQLYLEKQLGQQLLVCPLARIGDYLDGEADGLLLLSAAKDDEVQPIVRLVQDICLQKYPPIVVLLDLSHRPDSPLAMLEPYVARWLRWPED